MAASDKFNYLPKSSEVQKAFADDAERLHHYKKHLKSGLLALVEQFKKNTSINQLLKGRSALVDNILITSWQQFQVNSGTSLIAVGGYGRSELQPFSDIDILILLDKRTQDTSKLESWLAFLWDIGLEVGHSVRNLQDCQILALDDITIATNLMESRFLCGDKQLHIELGEMTAQNDFWPSEDFYNAKLNEQRLRHRNFKDTSFNLEPNIKSTPGGLRDLQVMQWISLKHFQSRSLHDLIKREIFTRREYKTLLSHQQFLNRVRFALHAITRKCEDRLLFEHQKNVAEWLGFEDDANKLAVEHLMQRYYRAVMAIRNLNGLFIQIFEQDYLTKKQLVERQALGQDFYLEDNKIGILDLELFDKKPTALIEIFTHIGRDRTIRKIEAATLRKIRSSQHLINAKFRKDPKNLASLRKFYANKNLTSRGFALMKRTNVLAALLPLFAKIEGQMQFDLFHAYTVDEHTLFLLRFLIRFNRPESIQEFPICSEIMDKQADHSVIHLAALFHDIAKGRGGDHSELGEVDARNYCQNIGLEAQQAETVAWLVKNHLIMSMVAQRKDISDPDVIAEFGQRIPDLQHLELLYVLTVADIRATNPTLWNSWKESLLKELFLSTQYYLEQSSPGTELENIVQDNRQLVLETFSGQDKSIEPIKQLLKQFGDDYLLRYHPEQIHWQLSQLINNTERPYIAIKNHRTQAGTEIFNAIDDQPDLFAAIASLLSQNHLNVQAATLFTSSKGHCLNTFIVLDEEGQPLSYQQRIDEIQHNLKTSLSQIANLSLSVNRALPSRYKHFNVPTKINFTQDKANNLTLLELSALDRPALLAKIALAFRDANVRIHAAKIVTLGEKVEDTFSLSKPNNQPLTDAAELEELKQHILKLIDS